MPLYLSQNTGFKVTPGTQTIYAGSLWTSGHNNYGELGDGTTVNKSSPIQIGSLINWSNVYGTGYGAAAIKTDGTLWTWGYNAQGQLGNGTTINYSSPIQIGSLTTWSSAYIGSSGLAAIKTDGTLWVCGYNNSGGLGNGTTIKYSSPIQVGSLTTWKQAVIFGCTIAVKTDGTLWTWGRNSFGQLGNGTTINYSSPIQVGSLTNWKQVAADGLSVAAVKTDGTLWTWGYNSVGELGNGTPAVSYSSPIQIGSLTNWSSVDANNTAKLALKTDGTIWGWGMNYFGAFCNGTTVNYSSPIQVGSLTNWSSVVCGSSMYAGKKTDGSIWVWGSDAYGQLGNNASGINYSSPIQVGSLTNWGSIVCGYYSIYAIPSSTKTYTPGQQTVYAGGLWGCGYNIYGGLGNGTSNNSYSSPIQVGSLTNWSSVSGGGNYYNVSIKTDGTLWSCGYNGTGQLGNGTTTNYSSPIQIGLLSTWSSVSAGSSFVSAVKTDGTLWTWGQNNYGQLGNGTTTNYSSPIQVGSLTNWSSVSSGQNNSAALKTDGTLWTWGYNVNGSLGNGTTINYSSPIQIGSLTTWSKVSSGGGYMAAIKTDGTLWTWGTNGSGQLGNGTTINYSSPIQIGSLTTWSKVSYGASFLAAIKTDGTLWTCGYNAYGQLGNGTVVYYSSPIQVGSLTNWSQVGCRNSSSHIVAVKTDGTLWTWGYNNKGQLSNGTIINYSSPIQVGSLTNWGSVSSGFSSTFAIPSQTQTVLPTQDLGQLYVSKDYLLDVYPNIASATGARTAPGLWIWGGQSQNIGTLGIGSSSSLKYSSPIQIGSLTNWKQISCNNKHWLSIKTDGTLWGCGYNYYGQLGNGTNTTTYSSPIQIGSLTNWSQVSAGDSGTSTAIKTDGTLWTWGYNDYGNLGNNTRTYYSSPIQIGSLTNWKQIFCGYSVTAAIKTDGTLWTWGGGNPSFYAYGQLGNNTTSNYSSPIQVGSLTNWKQVGGGDYHASAVKTDGTLWAWGYNAYGQLGNGTTVNYSSPIQVGSLTAWKQVSSGGLSTAAVKTDGTLWTWGYNYYGVLGNGTNINYSSPVQIGSLTNWKTVYVGNVLLAIKTDGTLWGCGYNYQGELGNGVTNTSYSSPVQIGSLSNWKSISRRTAIADGYY